MSCRKRISKTSIAIGWTSRFGSSLKLARLHRDKGSRGDGFEWAVHETIVGGEPRVVDLVSEALRKVSPRSFADLDRPTFLMFGHERARHLGFTDAVVNNASGDAVLLPDGSGRPFAFGSWVPIAARGVAAEAQLRDRIKKVWKTDLFLSSFEKARFAAATIKSNWHQLEDGARSCTLLLQAECQGAEDSGAT